MTDKKETAVSHDAVKTQLANLTLKNAELEKDIKEVTEERDALKQQCIQLSSVIENDLKADLRVRILAKSDFKDSDLEQKTVQELQQIDEILATSKAGGAATYTSIRAGAAKPQSQAGMTVGSLFGKTRPEILAMGGEF